MILQSHSLLQQPSIIQTPSQCTFSFVSSHMLRCRRVTNRLSARRMRQKRAEEREAVAHEVW